MSRLSIFKPSKVSTKSSVQSSAETSRRSSLASELSSSVSYVHFPGQAVSQQRQASQPSDAQSPGAKYAEMLEDENMAWGKPKKSSRR
ncbi:hypothetical protein BD413DRAFT_613539 [Trametes elegans]|nr:hypothetical protein BD413DRAFT_613539 [Trametes elegans]